MKLLTALVATTVAALVSSAPANAALPPAKYIKRAVFIRAHYDGDFYAHWHDEKGLTTQQLTDMVRAHFDNVRSAYLNTGSLQNIKLFLLEDFTRASGPMVSYRDSAPQINGHIRLQDAMRARLKTSNVNRTTSDGVNHLLGRTLNVVFTYGNHGNQQGWTDTIGGIGLADANIFISTSGGDLTAGGRYYPLSEQRDDVIRDTMIHEIGHALGGEHGGADELADCPGGTTNEIMCTNHFPRQRRFGSANIQRVSTVLTNRLGRCNTAYTSYSQCEQAVIADCSMIGDYTKIQPCIDFAVPAACANICSAATKADVAVIDGLATRLGPLIVVAPGPAQ